MPPRNRDTMIVQRAFDGKYQVLRNMYLEPLPKDIREKHQGYPEYWTKRWVCVRIFDKLEQAIKFVE